jgi:hypothetical protein
MRRTVVAAVRELGAMGLFLAAGVVLMLGMLAVR